MTAGPVPTATLQRNAENTFDAADRLVSATVAYGGSATPVTETFLYDGNGAMTNATSGGETVFDASYDAQGRLASASIRGSGAPAASTAFSYDALGNRVGVGGHIFVPDHSDPLKRPLVECDADGNPIRYYIWGPGRLLGFIDAEGTLTVAHADEQGSVIALTDENGNLLYRAAYSPHGEDWGSSGTNATPFAWLGGLGVMRTGGPPSSAAAFSPLYLTRHRLYSPVLRRFLSTDPLGVDGGLNLYAYANGDPLAYIDPLGLCASDSDWITRIGGFFQMIGGSLETVLGYGFAAFTAETGFGIAAGMAVGIHGSDVATAGFYTMVNGVPQDTLTSQGLQAVGVPQDWANGVDAGVSMVGTMGVGAATRGGARSVNLIENSSRTIPVSHWGTKEISNGSWVMKGSGSRMDYLLSGKWQPEWMPGKNIPVSYGSGNVYNVPPGTLSFPSGGEWIKGFLGQRIYNGPTVLPSSPIQFK